MSDLSKPEQVYLQKCRLKTRQDALKPNLCNLLKKFYVILDSMEHLEGNMENFNWFYVEELLETMDTQIDLIYFTLVNYKLVWPDANNEN